MEKQLVPDDVTTISGSGSGSGVTDLSGLENETDDFGRQILQHERETRRARIEARQPFWRARPKSWVIDNIAGEEEKATETGRPGHRRTASAGNAGSDPPLNVPREWGKRSRRRGSWLRRHESDGDMLLTGSETQDEPVQMDEDSIIPRRTVYTGDGWAADADIPRQSIETTPPSMRRLQRQASSPSSMQHMNTTLTSADGDDDFSATSLLASTPAINQRSRKIDELMKREIETVEKRGVTRRTLNQISEKFSNESLRPSTAPASETSRIPRRRSTTSNKENESISSGESNGKQSNERSESRNNASQAISFKGPQKPSHSRNDSMSLLKRLARVSSLSPSPARSKSEAEEAAPRITNDQSDDHGEAGLLYRKQSDTQQEDKKLKVEFDLPDESTEAVGIPQKESQEPESRTTAKREPLKQSHHKSALAEVVNEAKGGLEPLIGESTIVSLENIINPTSDLSNPSTPTKSTSCAAQPPPMRFGDIASSRGESHRKRSIDPLETLTKGLNATKATIRDANQGLRIIEDKIGHVEIASISTELPPNAEPYLDHNGRTLCEHCGGCYTSVWRGLWVEFRENFYTWDPRAKYRLRLTWLGIACVAWWSWLFIESTLCSYYCHPRYAVSMEGYGVDPEAPEFPFVIPTLLFRPFRLLWRPVGVFLAWLLGVVLRAAFGGESQPHAPARTSWEEAAFGARAANLMPNANPAAHVARSVGIGKSWIATAAVVTSSTSKRIVESTVDAVDRFARMWENGIGPS